MAAQHEKALVPQIRFTGFTDPWEQRKLGELASKRIEKNTNGIKETFTNSAEHGVVSQLDYFDHDITNDANIGNYSVVHPDDFIYNPRISAVAPCGPINRNKLGRNGVMSPLYTVFSVDDTIDKLYLEHYFKTSRWHQFMFLEGNSGARSDRFSISDSIFFEMPIQCPVLEEQELIASFFGRLDSLITLHQRKYDKLCVLKKSMLDKMFPKGGSLYPEIRFAGFTDPWEQRKLGEVASGFEYGLNAAASDFDGEKKYLRITDIDDQTREFRTDDLSSPDINNPIDDRYLLKEGDILFARTGASVGKTYLYKASDGKTYYAGFLIRAHVSDEADAGFIFQSTLTERYKQFVLLTSQRSGQPGINAQEYSDLLLPLPSLMEQRRIGAFFDRLDSLITLHQRKLELLRNIKKSMLDKMFV
ncbi:restriction endonuclease subunit S [Bifidobacterium adolescentis]|uniref:restriction endonuclease subunit S n=3 Tax=Bifidobacterium adolescentis TaxID=1680 RepID=UPI00321A406A